MLSPMKNHVSSGKHDPAAEMSWTSISPMVTPLAALGGAAVMTIFTHDLPVKSIACARVRYTFCVTVASVVQVPFLPSVESPETSM